jgi:hypothetical protein
LLAAIELVGARLDRSVASCVHDAWLRASPDLAALAAPMPVEQGFLELEIEELQYTDPRAEALYAARFADVDTVRVELMLPADVFDAIRDEANRLARSQSWIVERAWCLADELRVHMDAGDTLPMPRFA